MHDAISVTFGFLAGGLCIALLVLQWPGEKK